MPTPDEERGEELRRRSGVEDLSPVVLWLYRQWWTRAGVSSVAALSALAGGGAWLMLVAVVLAAVGAMQCRDAKRG